MESNPKIQLVYFSPTGTTKHHLDAIMRGCGGTSAPGINLTKIEPRRNLAHELEGDIIFFGVPVYNGSIPVLLRDCFELLDGANRWVVIVATYGNVKVGTCIQDLAQILSSRDFRILGTAACLGEHSFCSKHLPLAPGRPDLDDLRKSEEFGGRLRQKLRTDPLPVSFPKNDLPPPKPRTSAILLPQVHPDLCIKCLLCVSACPTAAIDAQTLDITDDLCILCCACVKVCEARARVVQFNLPPDKFALFHENTKRRLEPEFCL